MEQVKGIEPSSLAWQANVLTVVLHLHMGWMMRIELMTARATIWCSTNWATSTIQKGGGDAPPNTIRSFVSHLLHRLDFILTTVLISYHWQPSVAVGVGFEPTDGYYPSLVFKTSAISRTLPPHQILAPQERFELLTLALSNQLNYQTLFILRKK